LMIRSCMSVDRFQYMSYFSDDLIVQGTGDQLAKERLPERDH
jgi:hypothetical protein